MSEPLSAHAITVKTADAGELTFDVLRNEASGGPQVIALHGFPQGARAWSGVGARLAERGIGLIAIDQRGYSPQARPVGVEHYLDRILSADVLAIADALDLDRFHLTGHDWGSHIAWVTAADHADRVQTLTAVSIPHPKAFARAYKEDPDQAERSGYFKLFWQPGKGEETMLADDAKLLRESLQDVPDEEKAHYVSRLQEPGALTAALSWYRAMRAGNGPVPNVAVPTTLVWSDQDRAVGRTSADLCEQYVDADYRLVTLEGVTHWIPERAPQPLAEAIADRVTGTSS